MKKRSVLFVVFASIVVISGAAGLFGGALVERFAPEEEVFMLTIDYNIPLEAAVKGSFLDNGPVTDLCMEKYFPGKGKGVRKVQCALFHFNGSARQAETLERMRREGYTFPGWRESIELQRQYPSKFRYWMDCKHAAREEGQSAQLETWTDVLDVGRSYDPRRCEFAVKED